MQEVINLSTPDLERQLVYISGLIKSLYDVEDYVLALKRNTFFLNNPDLNLYNIDTMISNIKYNYTFRHLQNLEKIIDAEILQRKRLGL